MIHAVSECCSAAETRHTRHMIGVVCMHILDCGNLATSYIAPTVHPFEASIIEVQCLHHKQFLSYAGSITEVPSHKLVVVV